MANQTKADLERTIKLQKEVIELQNQKINELQRQMTQKIESSPTYQNAIRDIWINQEMADMYKGLYERLKSANGACQ